MVALPFEWETKIGFYVVGNVLNFHHTETKDILSVHKSKKFFIILSVLPSIIARQ